MRTIEWPPVIRNGRMSYVEGQQAAAVLILQTVSDLRQNPFNPEGISLGDITYKVQSSARTRLDNALRRLEPIVSIEAIIETLAENGDAEYVIRYVDRESRTPGEVRVG